MGLLDFFRGPPSKDKFARLFIAELQALQPSDTFRYEKADFALARASGGFINLGNFYHEYCKLKPADRAAALRQFARTCLGTTVFELPTDFADVHPDLLPIIRSRFYYEGSMLQAKIKQGDSQLDIPQSIFAGNLAVSLVYDLPTAMRTINQSDLRDWGVTFYEALEAALDNLRQMGAGAFAQVGEGFFASATGDNYDASRLLLLNEVTDRLELKGDLIAMVPNRDSLLITGSEDLEGQAIMAEMAEASYDQPRPISTIALRLEGDEWTSWLPEPESPLYHRFNQLRLRTIGTEYADQQELLVALLKTQGDEAYVASFRGVENEKTGAVFSYCIWTQGIPTLLPEADRITFFQPLHDRTGDGDGKIVGSAPWEKARQVMGSLMVSTDHYPPRWLVTEFPTDAQLAAACDDFL